MRVGVLLSPRLLGTQPPCHQLLRPAVLLPRWLRRARHRGHWELLRHHHEAGAGDFSVSIRGRCVVCACKACRFHHQGTAVNPSLFCIPCGCPEAPCPNGTYCVNGSQVACPVGRYGSGPGFSSVNECPVCLNGAFCPANATFAADCGGTQFYCINGVRYNVMVGYYTTPTTPGTEMQRTNTSLCEAGYYCSSGNRTACPAGRYGNNPGQSSADCGTSSNADQGQCAAGYYCPAGSTSPTAFPCGNSSVYCPAVRLRPR